MFAWVRTRVEGSLGSGVRLAAAIVCLGLRRLVRGVTSRGSPTARGLVVCSVLLRRCRFLASGVSAWGPIGARVVWGWGPLIQNVSGNNDLPKLGWWLRVGMWWRQGALRGVHSPVAIESRFGVADAVGDQLPRLARSGSWACRGLGCRTLALFRRPIEVSSRPWNPGQAFAVRHPSVPAGCIRELPRVRAALRAWRCHRRRSKSSFRSGSAQSR